MSNDIYISALLRDAQLAVGLALSTNTCREAQAAHGLAATSAIALGRLLTSAALCQFIQSRPGQMSLQVVCSGRLRQLFADITEKGELRGYIKTPNLALPQVTEEPHGRHSISVGVVDGSLSVIRLEAQNEYQQSSVELVSGEVDSDVQHYLCNSEQIPSLLVCDVLLDKGKNIEIAGGLIVQALPQGSLSELQAIGEQVAGGGFAKQLQAHGNNPMALLKSLLPKASQLDTAIALRWACRCSLERVHAALAMLGPVDLAEMIDAEEVARVSCEFCGRQYSVAPDILEDIFTRTVTAQA